MSLAIYLLAALGCLGAFDTLYYHEWRAKLPALGRAAHSELQLHAWRDFVYAILFATLPWLAWQGRWAMALAALLLIEVVLTLMGFRGGGLDPQAAWRTLRRRAHHARDHGNHLRRDAGEIIPHAVELAIRCRPR